MDALMAALVFAVLFVPTIIYLTRSVGAADANRLAMRRMRPELMEEEVDITNRRRRADSGEGFLRLDMFRLLEESMWQAGIYMHVGDMLLVIVMFFAVGVAGGAYLWQDELYSLATGIILGSVPVLYIRWRRQRRMTAFNKQLPFALDLVKSSLEAGHSLQRAFQVLINEFTEPLGSEFRTVMEQTRIGLPLPRALEELLTRVPEDDLRLLVVSVKIQSQVGSSLAELVGRLSEVVRARQRLRLQVRALTAQARLGGILVAALPLIVLGAFSIIEPSYTRTLFTDPVGIKIVKAALFCDALAFVWIRKLLNVSY